MNYEKGQLLYSAELVDVLDDKPPCIMLHTHVVLSVGERQVRVQEYGSGFKQYYPVGNVPFYPSREEALAALQKQYTRAIKAAESRLTQSNNALRDVQDAISRGDVKERKLR